MIKLFTFQHTNFTLVFLDAVKNKYIYNNIIISQYKKPTTLESFFFEKIF